MENPGLEESRMEMHFIIKSFQNRTTMLRYLIVIIQFNSVQLFIFVYHNSIQLFIILFLCIITIQIKSNQFFIFVYHNYIQLFIFVHNNNSIQIKSVLYFCVLHQKPSGQLQMQHK